MYRGLQRAAGTVLGAGLGISTVLLAKLGLGALLGGLAVSLLAAYAVFTVNNLLYAVFLTDFVVVLLALLGLPPGPTAVARLAGTGIGTGLALLAYVLWPTWEGSSAAEKFAQLSIAQGRYAAALLRAYTRRRSSESAQLAELQLAARRARIDAVASADRLAGEPDREPMSSGLANALASSGHRTAQAVLSLGAAVTAHGTTATSAAADETALSDAQLRPGLDELASSVEQATGLIADSLRDLGHVRMQTALAALPPLRATMRAILAHQPDQTEPNRTEPRPTDPDKTGTRSTATGADRAGLVAAADGLVDAINTTADVLRAQGGANS